MNDEIKYYNRVGASFTVLSALMGLCFWPFMVTFLSGHDLFEDMADSLHWWFPTFWFMLMITTSIICGFVALAVFKGHEPQD